MTDDLLLDDVGMLLIEIDAASVGGLCTVLLDTVHAMTSDPRWESDQ